jgi:capsular polysaccharide biosynthesis protein
VLEEPLLRPRRRIQRPVVLLPPGNYYHWLLEYLPIALHALDESPEATVVVPVEAGAVCRGGARSARTRQGPPRRRAVCGRAARARSARAEIGLAPRRGHRDPPLEVPTERGHPGAAEDLYIWRRLTNRRPAKEAELEQLCAQLGVRPVVSERLPFREQVALFSSARTIVATHGAGLANLVFAEPGGRRLELFLPELFNECYADVAVLRGLSYEPFYCSGVDNSTSVAPLAEIAAVLGRS